MPASSPPPSARRYGGGLFPSCFLSLSLSLSSARAQATLTRRRLSLSLSLSPFILSSRGGLRFPRSGMPPPPPPPPWHSTPLLCGECGRQRRVQSRAPTAQRALTPRVEWEWEREGRRVGLERDFSLREERRFAAGRGLGLLFRLFSLFFSSLSFWEWRDKRMRRGWGGRGEWTRMLWCFEGYFRLS